MTTKEDLSEPSGFLLKRDGCTECDSKKIWYLGAEGNRDYYFVHLLCDACGADQHLRLPKSKGNLVIEFTPGKQEPVKDGQA